MIPDNLKNAINAAMEAASGKVPRAAILLGIKKETLHQHIANNKDLKALWKKPMHGVHPPNEESIIIHRPVPKALEQEQAFVTLSEEELAAAIKKEDDALAKGLENLGLSAASRETALALQKFHNKYWKKSIDMIGGGITKLFLDLLVEIQAIGDKLKGPLDVERENVLRKDRQALLEMIGRSYDRVNKATLTQAIVELKLAQSKKGGGLPGKPGFGRLTVVANQVQVNNGDNGNGRHE